MLSGAEDGKLDGAELELAGGIWNGSMSQNTLKIAMCFAKIPDTIWPKSPTLLLLLEQIPSEYFHNGLMNSRQAFSVQGLRSC